MTARIPRCCVEHRLHTLDALEALIAADAHDAVAEMIGEGCAPGDAVDSYRRWLLDRITIAIDIGALIAEGRQ